MKLISFNECNRGSAYTYIGFTNSSLTVDEDYETVIKRLVSAKKYMQLHSGGAPVLISVDKVEVVGDMEDE